MHSPLVTNAEPSLSLDHDVKEWIDTIRGLGNNLDLVMPVAQLPVSWVGDRISLGLIGLPDLPQQLHVSDPLG
jgi:hypothetical protein